MERASGRAAVRVGFQGERGAFSEEAVRRLFPSDGSLGHVEPDPHRTFRSVFDAIASREDDYGVVPLENSSAGSITEVYDLLASGEARIVGEAVLRVDHALLALPGTRLRDLRVVSSHPQALAQCQEYLASLDVEAIPVYDTAGAAKRIAEERRTGEAAVASARAAEVYGLEVLADGIQDEGLNQTRFAAVAPEGVAPLGSPDKTSLLFRVGHRPGALVRCLEPFAARGLNLSKLESRPLRDAPFQYRFYLDVEAAVDEPAVAASLREMEPFAAEVKVLGSYPRWRDEDARFTDGA